MVTTNYGFYHDQGFEPRWISWLLLTEVKSREDAIMSVVWWGAGKWKKGLEDCVPQPKPDLLTIFRNLTLDNWTIVMYTDYCVEEFSSLTQPKNNKC